jgi:hypothetical protein
MCMDTNKRQFSTDFELNSYILVIREALFSSLHFILFCAADSPVNIDDTEIL